MGIAGSFVLFRKTAAHNVILCTCRLNELASSNSFIGKVISVLETDLPFVHHLNIMDELGLTDTKHFLSQFGGNDEEWKAQFGEC